MDDGHAVRAALQEASAALGRGDPAAAERRLAQAERAAPADLDIKLQLALVKRLSGRLEEAVAVLDQALAIDPYCFLALLSKGAIVERQGQARAAARIYKDALAIAPADLPPGLAAPVARTRAAVERNAEDLEAFLRARVSARDLPPRFAEGLEVYAGRKRVYNSQPLLLHYPGLPSIPFFEREHFPWLPDLEAATDIVRDELLASLDPALTGFDPYIAYPPGAPVNQWEELNHSRKWTSKWLWKDGQVQAEVQSAHPRTTALLDSLPLARQAGFSPTAVFSALEPRTHIPPHTGSTNVRLLVHLPLILPGPARFRVGNHTRSWEMGKAWVFDDTIEHEAWNDADQTRVILIFDVWNPLLGEGERAMITEMMTARRAFYAAEGE
ncbi:aspartyl/asparaginyl beta-hydroxylase domain-containing protein [Caulobacter hibisci]|uniref:Aspartyl/asparaginyl beta-hydroxylase domain-containing protein n=1 Tax=Caulobacter hibisci TaxID=2035993 RepID=A0ABS0SVG2_9CAUL|nr:aspartyl/asparaginyl beta-hydroxylase domain-containing protein [Caulobacter hibisci]MBI1682627.1 aspartyl/asparaginyl beta-hydroxylase domain-containing protein [Caulobacter hibisci]